MTGKPSGDLSLTAIITAGGAAGVAMWVTIYPVDTVKSRLQSMDGKPTVSGIIKSVYAKGGIKAFFPGFGPAIARAIPANAATFVGVEFAHKAMDKVFG
jgi:solute carrier family 25 carnitine/acylcarnitine transporter 20/29